MEANFKLPPIASQSGFPEQNEIHSTSEPTDSAEQARSKMENTEANAHTSDAPITTGASIESNTQNTELENATNAFIARYGDPGPSTDEEGAVQDWHLRLFLDWVIRRGQGYLIDPPKDEAEMFILAALKSLASIVHPDGVNTENSTNTQPQNEQQNRPFVNYVAPSMPSSFPHSQIPTTGGHQSATSNTVLNGEACITISTGNTAIKARTAEKIPAPVKNARKPRVKRQTKKSMDIIKNNTTPASFLTPQTNTDFLNVQQVHSSAPSRVQNPSPLSSSPQYGTDRNLPYFSPSTASSSTTTTPASNDLVAKRMEILKNYHHRHQPYLNTYRQRHGQQLSSGNIPYQAANNTGLQHTISANQPARLFTRPDALTPGAGLAYPVQTNSYIQSLRPAQTPNSQVLTPGSNAGITTSPFSNSFAFQQLPYSNAPPQNYGPSLPITPINVSNYGNSQNEHSLSSIPYNSVPSNQAQQFHQTEDVQSLRTPMFTGSFNPQWLNEQYNRRQSTATPLPLSKNVYTNTDNMFK